MFKYIVSVLSLALSGAISAKTASESGLTAQDLSNFSVQDQRLIEASFPELIKDASKGGAVVATIGGDGGCSFNSSIRATPIQDAIDWTAVTYTELRIVEDTYDEENITLNDRSMVIKGGYASCADATNGILSSPDSLATIIQSSTDTNPVFRIEGNTTRNNVSMYNLTIKNSGSSGWFGGAIRISNADASVSLNKMALTGNTGLRGGAIGVTGTSGEPLVTLNSVRLSNNSAQEGGGVFCTHPAARVIQNFSSGETHGIYSNTATAGDGGGVLIEDGCAFTSYQGSQDIGLFGSERRGITYNTATGNGGGIAIRSGGEATLYGRNTCFFIFNNYLCLFGNNSEPVSLSLNVADQDDDGNGDGGAIHVSGTSSKLKAENASMVLNFARNGAAVAVDDNASALITTAFENEAGPIGCWQPGACLDFNFNLAESFGGAFYVKAGAQLNVANAQVRNHRANTGVAGYVRDINSILDVESGFVFNNGDNGTGDYVDAHVFRAFNSAELNLAFVTVADNKQAGAVITNSGSAVNVGSSIIHDQRASAPVVYLESGTTPTSGFDCVMAHEDSSFSGIFVTVADPEFVDRGNDDFHLAGNSPAIDYCDDFTTQANYKDIDGDDRGWDDLTVSNFVGPYDIGADESFANDLIFKDGFE